MKNKKYYTIYKIDRDTNDIENVAEFEEREKASEWLGTSLKHLSDYVCTNIDNIKCKLRQNKYFVMIELDD